MHDPLLYQIQNLDSARAFLKQYQTAVILTNPAGSVRYYGMLVLDYMFKCLSNEFSNITRIIVNVEDDHAALFTAIKLDYKHIIYNGTSKAAQKLLENHLQKI